MLFTVDTVSKEELNTITNFFENFEAELTTVTPEEAQEETSVSKYITSLAGNCYAKSIEAIANTKVNNRVVKRRNLQQIMQESFFYGANRFGNNFIA